MRYRIGIFIVAVGFIAMCAGMFSAQKDPRAGLFGIPAVELATGGLAVMIIGMLVYPRGWRYLLPGKTKGSR